MMTNLIMWGSIIWIIPLVYFMQKNETKFKKNIVIGVTLPFEAREDAQVQEILRKFLKQLKILCIIMLISAVLCMPIRDFGVMMLVYLLWIDVFLVLTYIPYIRCNKALKELKIQRGWKKTQTETVANLELAGTSVKWLSPMVFDSAGGESDSTYRRQDFLDGLCDGCRSCSFFLAGLPFHVPEKSRDCR